MSGSGRAQRGTGVEARGFFRSEIFLLCAAETENVALESGKGHRRGPEADRRKTGRRRDAQTRSKKVGHEKSENEKRRTLDSEAVESQEADQEGFEEEPEDAEGQEINNVRI